MSRTTTSFRQQLTKPSEQFTNSYNTRVAAADETLKISSTYIHVFDLYFGVGTVTSVLGVVGSRHTFISSSLFSPCPASVQPPSVRVLFIGALNTTGIVLSVIRFMFATNANGITHFTREWLNDSTNLVFDPRNNVSHLIPKFLSRGYTHHRGCQVH